MNGVDLYLHHRFAEMKKLHSTDINPLKQAFLLLQLVVTGFFLIFITPALGGVAMLVGTYFVDLGVLLLMINSLPPAYFAAKAFNFIKLKNNKTVFLLGSVVGLLYMLSCWPWFYLLLQSTNIVDLKASGLDASGAYWPWEDAARFAEWIDFYVYQEDKRMASVGLMVALGKLTGLRFFNEIPGLTGKALYVFWVLEAVYISWFVAYTIRLTPSNLGGTKG